MFTTAKRPETEEEILVSARRDRFFGNEYSGNAEMPVRNFNYSTDSQRSFGNETVYRESVRNPEADRAARILFDRGGAAAPDNAPIGSQGAVVTPADRYFSPFNHDETVNRRVSGASAGSVFVPPYEAKRAKNEFKYFTGEASTATAEPETKRKSSTALRPSEETLTYRERKGENEKKGLLNSRGKVIVAIYAAVMVFLIAMIITSGVTAAKLNKDITGLQDNVNVTKELNTILKNELVLIGNDSVLEDKAENIGMVGSDGTFEEVTLIPMVDPVEYAARSNWFDKFCDWLSRIFGG